MREIETSKAITLLRFQRNFAFNSINTINLLFTMEFFLVFLHLCFVFNFKVIRCRFWCMCSSFFSTFLVFISRYFRSENKVSDMFMKQMKRWNATIFSVSTVFQFNIEGNSIRRTTTKKSFQFIPYICHSRWWFLSSCSFLSLYECRS